MLVCFCFSAVNYDSSIQAKEMLLLAESTEKQKTWITHLSKKISKKGIVSSGNLGYVSLCKIILLQPVLFFSLLYVYDKPVYTSVRPLPHHSDAILDTPDGVGGELDVGVGEWVGAVDPMQGRISGSSHHRLYDLLHVAGNVDKRPCTVACTCHMVRLH